jgi:hypothetical protein
MEKEKKLCVHCGKSLPKIGTDRKNGKLYNKYDLTAFSKDWASRKYHKKCYKEYQDHLQIQIDIQRLIKEQENEKKYKE